MVVGTNMGRLVAQRLALLAPDRAAGLLLVVTTVAAEDPPLAAGYVALRQAFASGDRGAAEAVVNATVMICHGDGADSATWHDRSYPLAAAEQIAIAVGGCRALRPVADGRTS